MQAPSYRCGPRTANIHVAAVIIPQGAPQASPEVGIARISITQEQIDTTHGLGLISERVTSLVNSVVTHTTHYFRWDGIGSLRNLEDASRNILVSSVFDAYGLQQNSTTLASAYGFIGEAGVRGEKNQAPGSAVPWHMRARVYDPVTCRFTSRDPIWQQNLYEYGKDNPWRYTDPSGMQEGALAAEEHDIFRRYPGLTHRQRRRVEQILRTINCYGGGRFKDPEAFGEPALWRLLESYRHPGGTHLTASESLFAQSLGVPLDSRVPGARGALERIVGLRYIPGAEDAAGNINTQSAAAASAAEHAIYDGFSRFPNLPPVRHPAAAPLSPAIASAGDAGTTDPLMPPSGLETWVGNKTMGAFPVTFQPGTPTLGGAVRQSQQWTEEDDGTAAYYRAIGRFGHVVGHGVLPFALGTVLVAAVPGGGGRAERGVGAAARAERSVPQLFWHGSEEAVRMRQTVVDAETGARGMFLPVRAGEATGVGGKMWVTTRAAGRTGVGNWLVGGDINLWPLSRLGRKGGFNASYALTPAEAQLFRRAWGPEFSWNVSQWWKGAVGQHYLQIVPVTRLQRAQELSGTVISAYAVYKGAQFLAWLTDPIDGPLTSRRRRGNP